VREKEKKEREKEASPEKEEAEEGKRDKGGRNTARAEGFFFFFRLNVKKSLREGHSASVGWREDGLVGDA